MNNYKKTAVIVGVLYILGTLTGILSVIFTGSLLDGPDFLNKIAANQNQFKIAALCVLAMGFVLAIVSLMLYPILKKYNQRLALGYVVFRGALETVSSIILVITWLFLANLSLQYVAGGAVNAFFFQPMGDLFLKGADSISAVGGLIFSLGALMLYYVFYQSKLVPRWLSVWGFLAIILHLTTIFLIMFNLQSPFSPLNFVMNFPIFLQEMVMAVWLIVKAFNAQTTNTKIQISN